MGQGSQPLTQAVKTRQSTADLKSADSQAGLSHSFEIGLQHEYYTLGDSHSPLPWLTIAQQGG
jgi:hypothetical protein